MGSKPVGRLLKGVLPPEFEQIKRRQPEIQKFLEQNLPPPVSGRVTLLKLDHEQVVLAASSPTVVNYLRLHATEIRQQLRETFGLEQAIKFRTVPDSLLQLESCEPVRTPQPASAEAVAALERNAQWIEDDKLRAAIISLAQCLKAD